jgi:protein-S-isoprenylcysteine O-methyltransferase Ste14
MKRLREFIYNLHPYLLCCLSGPLTIAQVVLALVFSQPGSEAIRWIGYILWWVGVVLGWLPIFILRSKGGVPRGKSYVHTTTLVETGLYAIVRHPQMGSAWMLMCLSLMLITQHWSSVLLGIPAMVLVYLDLMKADQRCIEKFGDAYQQYIQRVPRVNFAAGLIRLLARRAAQKVEIA